LELRRCGHELAAAHSLGEGDIDGLHGGRDESGRFREALALVDAFRRGKRPASQVFNADRIARRLALIDLVGGHHSLDWSDVKFYFDPGAQRLETVSYESFSAFPTVDLAGAYSYTGVFNTDEDLHPQLLSDPVVMAAYIHHLERVSQKAYLDSAFTALAGPLDTASATLYREFPYKELDRSIYYANQKAIQRLLAAPRPLHWPAPPRAAPCSATVASPPQLLPRRLPHRAGQLPAAVARTRSRTHARARRAWR
jgi:hypothetical protein